MVVYVADSERNGICRDGWYGLGLAYCDGFHPMRCHGHGGALFGDAHQVLIFCMLV